MIKNKNILALCTTAFFNDRGCHTRILKILKYMENGNNRIDLVCYSYGRNIEGYRIYRVGKLFKYFDPVGFHFLKIIFDVQIFFKAFRMLREKDYDYILSFTHEAGILALILKFVYKKEYILDYQGSLYSELSTSNFIFKIPPFSFFIILIERLVEKYSYAIIYNTNFNFSKSRKNRRYFVDDEIIFYEKDEEQQYNCSSPKRIVWVGVNTKVQNLSTFLKIAENIVEKKDALFYIITFPLNKKIKERFKRYKDKIIFIEKVPYEELPAYLKKADICVSTKLDSTEGSGKLHLYKKYCKNILSLDSKISREILDEKQIVRNLEDMEKKILEIME